MPAYLVRQLYIVATLMPCLRLTSATGTPDSISCSTTKICFSVKRDFFIVESFQIILFLPLADSTFNLYYFRGYLPTHLKNFRSLYPNRWPGKKEEFPKGNKLGGWYGAQQHRFKRGLLQSWQIKALEELGFIGDVFNSKWNNQFNYLIEFRKLNPDRWPIATEDFPVGNKLGQWCSDQRSNYKNDLLNETRIKLLENTGFPWDLLIYEWNKQFNYLVEFRKLNLIRWPKHKEEFPVNNKLGVWCSIQREALKKGQLSDSQIESLNSIKFIWNNFHNAWDKRFNYLLEFRKLHPTRWPKKGEEFPTGNKIADWCVDQRKKFKQGKLSPDRKNRLKEIGFPWSLK